MAGQLSRHSTPHRDPVARIAWGRLDTETYWLPPSAISLYGLPEFEGPSLAVLKYRLHELREEAGHSLMFLELMERSRLPLPARAVRAS